MHESGEEQSAGADVVVVVATELGVDAAPDPSAVPSFDEHAPAAIHSTMIAIADRWTLRLTTAISFVRLA